MADVRGLLARYLRDHAGMILLTSLAVMAAAGGLVMIYGAGGHSRHMVQDGVDYIIVAFCFGIPGLIGYWVAMAKRRIHVEDELAEVQETLLRIEEMAGGGPRRTGGTVHPIHRN